MTRLRNRIRKAEYFTDGELLRWHRDKRATYSGLWAIAEDSGCLEDDPFAWKVAIWPSPLDSDITVELLEKWRDELVAAGKLIPYEADEKRYLYIRTFHQHEKPRNPQRPDLPLPEWIAHDVKSGTSDDGKRWQKHSFRDTKYAPDEGNECSTESVQSPPPRPAPSRVPKGTKGRGGVVLNSTTHATPSEEHASGDDVTVTCSRCGGVITTDVLADEALVCGDGYTWWHRACTNGKPKARAAQVTT